MADIQFSPQRIEQLWQRKAGQLPQTAGAGEAGELEKALADNKLTKGEFEALKARYLSETQGQSAPDFETFLADALDGKLDGQAKERITDAVRRLAAHEGAPVAVSFDLNAGRDGFSNPAALSFNTDANLEARLKAADANHDGKVNGSENQILVNLLTGLPDNPNLQKLKAQLQDSLSSVVYDPENHTATLYLTDAVPSLADNPNRDVRFTGSIHLEDADGVETHSQGDLSGQVNGQAHVQTGFLNELIREIITPAINEHVNGSFQGIGYGVMLHEGRFDPKRSAFVIPGIAQIGGNPLQIEILIRSDHGRLVIEVPALEQDFERNRMMDFNDPIDVAKRKINEELLNIIGQQIEHNVNQQDMVIKLTPSIESWETKTAAGRVTDTYHTNQFLVLQPSLELGLDASFLPGGNDDDKRLNLTLAADKNNTDVTVDANGIHIGLTHVPVSGSSVTDPEGVPLAIGDRSPDIIDASIDYGLGIDLALAHERSEHPLVEEDPDAPKVVTHDLAIQNASLDLKLSRGEVQQFDMLPQDLRDRLGNSESHVSVQLRGRPESLEGQIELSGNAQRGDLTQLDIRHFRLDRTEDGRALQMAGVSLDTDQREGQIHVEAGTASADVADDGRINVRLHDTQAHALSSPAGLARLKASLLAEAQKGSTRVRELLAQAGISGADIRTLLATPDDQLGQLLNLGDFARRLAAIDVTLQAQMLEVEVSESEISARTQGLEVGLETTDAPIRGQASSGGAIGGVSLEAGEVHLNRTATGTELVDADADGVDAAFVAEAPLLNRTLRVRVDAERVRDGQIDQGEANLNHSVIDAEGHASELSLTNSGSQGSQTVRLDAHLAGDRASLDLTAILADVRYQRQDDGSYLLTGHADAQLKAEVFDELREFVSQLGGEKTRALLAAGSQDELKAALQQAGLSEPKAQRAAELLYNPSVQGLLASSDFMATLLSADKLDIQIQSNGDLRVRTQDETSSTSYSGQHSAEIRVRNAGAEVLDATLSTGPDATLTRDAEGTRFEASSVSFDLDAQGLGRLQTSFNQFAAGLVADGALTATTTGGSLNYSFRTRLDEDKIKGFQELLTGFTDKIAAKLSDFGLGKEKVDQILQAFGREQFQQIFSRLSGPAASQQLDQVLSEFGLDERQLGQIKQLFETSQFQEIMKNITAFSAAFNDANLSLGGHLDFGAGRLEHGPEGNTAALEEVHGSTQITTEKDGAQTRGNLVVERGNFSLDGDGLHARNSSGSATIVAETGGQTMVLTGDASLERADSQPEGGVVIQEGSAHLDARLNPGTDHATTVLVDARAAELRTEGHEQVTVEGGSLDATATAQTVENGHSVSSDLGLRARADEVVSDGSDKTLDVTNGHLNVTAGRRTNAPTVDDQPPAAPLAETGGSVDIHAATLNQTGESMHAEDVDVQASLTTRTDTSFDSTVTADVHADDLRAEDKTVSWEQGSGSASVRLRAPEISGEASASFEAEQGTLTDGVLSSETARLDQGQGHLDISPAKLREMLSYNPAAAGLLSKLEQQLRLQNEKNPVENQQLRLEFQELAYQADGTGRRALSGDVSMQDIQTRWGEAELNVHIEELARRPAPGAVPGAAPGAQPPAEGSQASPGLDLKLEGTIDFAPSAEFRQRVNDKIKEILAPHLQRMGISRPEDLRVELRDGKIEIGFADSYKAGPLSLPFDGVVSVYASGGELHVAIDEARALRVLPLVWSGLPGKGVESGLEGGMMPYREQEIQTGTESDGTPQLREVYSIPLADLSREILGGDNLVVKDVQLGSDDHLQISFDYTDTATHEAETQQRSQANLGDRLFRENGQASGRPRSDEEISDYLQGLSADNQRRVLREASPEQLARIFAALGNDDDNFICSALNARSIDTPYLAGLKAIPLETRSLIANRLLSRGPDSDARRVLTGLVEASLDPDQADSFLSAMPARQLSQCLAAVNEVKGASAEPFMGRVYGQLRSDTSRAGFAQALVQGLGADEALGQLRQLPRRFPQPNLSAALFTLSDDAKLADMANELTPEELRTVFSHASPPELRRLLSAVGNDYDDIVRKALNPATGLNAFPVANRALMAAALANDRGFGESVRDGEKALIRTLRASVVEAEQAAFWATLGPDEARRVRAQLNP